MPESMAMVAGGFEAQESARRGPGLVSASLMSLVLGLLVYATGAIMYAFAYHHLIYWGLAENRTTWTDMYEWSGWVKDVGAILVILGLVFYVAGRRKGV